ncbi:hypothetical protein NLU13_9552 [Sarocladium strictum]|uniref:Cytochrome P450 n=1 Tax=Sarocladium strictum TaxID=5046 RepID=A0AA39L3Y9_SARSR|nr:hypothetical protein NLU13_9552 [Sarocladium strictum]
MPPKKMDYWIPTTPYICILLLGGLLISSTYTVKSQEAKRTFPGPTQLPLIGRVHDLPRKATWLKFYEWAAKYGPIYQTSMMGQKFVIISDEEIARDLLHKRADQTSGRAQIRALLNHRQDPTYFALQDRQETWRMQRKWVHAALSASYQQHFHGHLEDEIRRWLMTLLVDPAEFHSNTRELTGRAMARLTWDDATQGRQHADEALETLTNMSIHGSLANTAPFLWHLGDFIGYNPWKKYEIEREGKLKEHWLQNFRTARRRYLDCNLTDSTWSHRYFDQLSKAGNVTLEQSEKEEEVAACMLGFQCMVGIITVATPLMYLMMALTLHPEWQDKVQEEIEHVCGQRLPGLQDYAQLPTLRACIKEALRWRSSVPLGVPHRCEETMEYEGVLLEKDTIVMSCEWNLNRDPKNFPEPESYLPSRWLSPDFPTYLSPLTRHPNLREGRAMHTFGWGRRVCLGQQLADDELFLAAGAVCWGFRMRPKRNPSTGEEVEIDTMATNSNVILEPLPWQMEFLPRGGRVDAMGKEKGDVREKLGV